MFIFLERDIDNFWFGDITLSERNDSNLCSSGAQVTINCKR